MKVFLTGATGFIGHHVAQALAAEGAHLRLLVRKNSKLANLEGIKGETHVGDLADPESLRPALSDCDAVVHVAADYRLWIPDPAAMYKANVDGTRELLRLAREARVKRFIYTSSVATMHFRRDGLVINEDTPVSLADMVGHYKRSKFLAEQEAIKAAQGGQRVVILNPTTPIGPNDAKPTPTGRSFVDFHNGQISRLHGHRAESGRCRRSRPHARYRADERPAGPALYSGRRKPDPQADSRQDGIDHWTQIADGGDSFHRGGDLRLL
jgi:dihydroflavonol-4-reductase